MDRTPRNVHAEFESFYTASFSRLVGQLALVTGDLHEAEDLVQEAFARERLEELADGYARAAAAPDPAALRQRRRRRRRRTAAGLVLLVVAVAAVVFAVGRARPPSPPPVGSSQVLTRPQEGYRLQIPPGWQATSQLGQIKLQAPGGSISVGLRTGVSLDPRLTTAADRAAAVLPGVEGFLRVERGFGRVSYGTRPDGRPFLHAEETLPGHGTVLSAVAATYMIAWPYHCAPATPCPALTRLRVLEFYVAGEVSAWPRARAAVEQMVRTVQPIGNAVDGSARAHPACRTGRNGDLASPHPQVGTGPDTNAVRFTLGAVSWRVIPCHVHTRVSVEIQQVWHVQNDPKTEARTHVATHDISRPAPVRGNGAGVLLDGDLPEGGADRTGALTATWEWSNWCATKARRIDGYQVVDSSIEVWLLHDGHRVELVGRGRLPRCVNPAAPSVLRIMD